MIELKRGNEERIAQVEPSKLTSCDKCGSEYHMQRECFDPNVKVLENKPVKLIDKEQ